jgi:hypothetical protein
MRTMAQERKLEIVTEPTEDAMSSQFKLLFALPLAAIAGALALAACASGSGGEATAAAQPPLTGPEITAAVASHTMKHEQFVEYFADDGTIRGSSKGNAYAGTWRVDADKLCVDIPQDNYNHCGAVYDAGDGNLQLEGKTKLWTVSAIAGNPEGL